MTKISAFFQLPADVSKRDVHGDKSDMNSQHENWMRQMELSMMADVSQHGGSNSNTAQARKPGLKSAMPSKVEPDNKTTQLENPSTPKRNLYPVSAVAKNLTHVESNTAKPVDAGVLDKSMASNIAAEEQSQVGGSGEQQSLQLKQNAGIRSDVLGVSNRPGSDTVTFFGSTTASAPKVASDVSIGKYNSFDAPQVQATSQRVPGLLRDISRGSASEQSDIHNDALDIAEKVQTPGVEQDQDTQVWQKRMMHITTDDQNVSVWIRDQEIKAEQTPQLISQLASEMAESGLRLNGATINGKLVFKQKDADKDDELALFSDDEVVLSSCDASERDIPLSYIKKGQ